MPRRHQPLARVRPQLQPALRQQRAERHVVQLVEVAPGPGALVDLRENRDVARAPVVGELGWIAGHAAVGERRRDRRAPVDQRPEHVEDERAYRHRVAPTWP
jgi:hypothetical protein